MVLRCARFARGGSAFVAERAIQRFIDSNDSSNDSSFSASNNENNMSWGDRKWSSKA